MKGYFRAEVFLFVLIVLIVVAQIEELDLVVGGHSHTFLYSGPPPRSQHSIDLSVNVYANCVKV